MVWTKLQAGRNAIEDFFIRKMAALLRSQCSKTLECVFPYFLKLKSKCFDALISHSVDEDANMDLWERMRGFVFAWWQYRQFLSICYCGSLKYFLVWTDGKMLNCLNISCLIFQSLVPFDPSKLFGWQSTNTLAVSGKLVPWFLWFSFLTMVVGSPSCGMVGQKNLMERPFLLQQCDVFH